MWDQSETELRRVVHTTCLHIAVDGPAAAGKSTVGRGIAQVLECAYLDTGLMYRAVTERVLASDTDPASESDVVAVASAMSFGVAHADGDAILVDGVRLGQTLRTPAIDASVSTVSAHRSVRAMLVERQRDLARGRCTVMVGRDIGTVVLPDAPLKFWVTASADVRARRRFQEGLAPAAVSVQRVQEEIEARDYVDSHRHVSPLRPAPGAIEICTDGESPDASVRTALDMVRKMVEHRNEAREP
ncbi:MAG: (d)CMP kinase [Chloroflexota bacterium]